MDFMGARHGYNCEDEADEPHHHHQHHHPHQMNMVNVMLPFSSPNNTSASSPSSSSASPNCSRGSLAMPCWDSRANNCDRTMQQPQQQQSPWAWPAPEKRVDEEVEAGEEEICGGSKWTRLNNEEGTEMMMIGASAEREHMFDKVVTPSDVGKLNRLVIPKQHAEKYFPLDSSANEKGLLLNFEDRSGKPWRFRYSYWNSSQSYVMTKGWSRFVKEKRLDAGDVVSFFRGVGEPGKDRLYIDWRRRPDEPAPYNVAAAPFLPSHHPLACLRRPPSSSSSPSQPPWTPLFWGPPPPPPPPSGPWHHHHKQQQQHPWDSSYGTSVGMSPFLYHPHHQQLIRRSTSTTTAATRQQAGAGAHGVHHEVQEGDQGSRADHPMVLESVPVAVPGKPSAAPKKRLRLFGVNMECPTPPPECECEFALSPTITTTASIQYHHLSHPAGLAPQVQPDEISSHPRPLHFGLYHGTPLLNKDKPSASSSSLDFEMLN